MYRRWAIGGVLVTIAALTAGTWLMSARRPSNPAMDVRLSIVPPAGIELIGDSANFDPEFAVSPDGTRLVFVGVSSSGTPSLWLRDLSSVTARELGGTAGARHPFWSPDGTAVGYVTPVGLARVSPDGGAPTEIATTLHPNLNSNSTWTPDGRIIYEGSELRSPRRERC